MEASFNRNLVRNPPRHEHYPVAGLDIATRALHADDEFATAVDIAPPMHVSTIFEYDPNPDNLIPADEMLKQESAERRHVYSRETAPTSTRYEAVLSSVIGAPTLTFSSGLAAINSIYTLLTPKRVCITGGYHGAHGVLELHQRLRGTQILPIECDASELEAGDVIHLETPLNPTGVARDISFYAEKAHSRGAFLIVDATFAPPPLQDPFAHGADIVMHSGTKYFGGHSDMLCGTLSTHNKDWFQTLTSDRLVLGSTLGSLEAWLGIRSIRTFELRLLRQSASAGSLVKFLHDTLHSSDKSTHAGLHKVLESVTHSSLQLADGSAPYLATQMPRGFNPVFAIHLRDERLARRLPSKLQLFRHATSLGGVESLVEWRCMSDSSASRKLLRVSVGVESWEDLRDDFLQAFEALAKESA